MKTPDQKILIAVENQVYPDILRSLFKLLKLSVKVIATSPKSLRLGEKNTDLIILDANQGLRHLPRMIEKILKRFPDTQIICLAQSKNSILYKMIRRYHVKTLFFSEKESLLRVFKTVKGLRKEKIGD